MGFMRVSCGFTLAAGLLLTAGYAVADPIGGYSEIISFGDSLSDSGNASIVTGGSEPAARGPGYYYRSVPGVPFKVGEFTNAPTATGPTGVWVDQLAPKLGVSVAQPFLAGGTNYAVADAVTGSSGIDNIDTEIAAFTARNLTGAPSKALYTIWGGANDVFDITNPANALSTGTTAADNLYKNIVTLSSEGARYFLWANLPDLGKTPGATAAGSGAVAVATAASNAFDGEWVADIMKLQASGIDVVGLDVASLFAAVEANPGKYGLMNITGSAITTPGANPDQYLFWDDVHPTAAADALLADAADAALTTNTPEPAAAGLAGLGLSALFLAAFKARRRKA
jgi:phospholipase/lecithinase/hemolysin